MPNRGGRRLMQNGVEDQRGGSTRKRLLSSGHLVEDKAEREQIGPNVDVLAARLLRRHVIDRTDGKPWARQHLGSLQRCRRRQRRILPVSERRLQWGELCDAEIEHLRMTVSRDEDVGGLDVAMDDALRMRGAECVGDLNRQFEEDFR